MSSGRKSGPGRRSRRANELSGNKLLAALPVEEYQRLRKLLTIVPLPFKQVLQSSRSRQQHVYFPAGGLCSIIAMMKDGRMAEVAAVGNEGMIGLPGIDACASRWEIVVQVPGAYAYAMPADAFDREMRRHGALFNVVSRYVQAMLAVLMQSAACNGLHSADQRCARWLLQSHDRIGKDDFGLTQEFLAVMLGVRRATVTMIAQQLQRTGLIALRRRGVTILDRRGLETVACECYAVVKACFERMLNDVS